MPCDAALLAVDHLSVDFMQRRALTPAVQDVSLSVAPAENLGVVGESGSGKSQIFLAALGLLPANARVQGTVRFRGEQLLGAGPGALNRVRGSALSMIFQDPMTSLTPHLSIGTQLAEVLVCHRDLSWREASRAAAAMLERVRIPHARQRMHDYPHQLSGGMRQRVLIAMSLLCGPALVIADEPTTALDVTVQAEILDLLRVMGAEFGTGLVLISHDLAVIAALADRILVMYAGRVVESGAASVLLGCPRHPYTAQLLACMPRMSGPLPARMPSLMGQPPRPGEPIDGCAFAPRCPRVVTRCRMERPRLMEAGGTWVACHQPLGA
jgi:oligopeptide transport system ATP-binding protein